MRPITVVQKVMMITSHMSYILHVISYISLQLLVSSLEKVSSVNLSLIKQCQLYMTSILVLFSDCSFISSFMGPNTNAIERNWINWNKLLIWFVFYVMFLWKSNSKLIFWLAQAALLFTHCFFTEPILLFPGLACHPLPRLSFFQT